VKPRHFLIPLTAAATGLAGVVLATTAEAATPPVSFTQVFYDSPGSDNRSATSLNQEFFRLTNNTTKAINLNRWTVRDASSHVYTFPAVSLAGKTSVIVHTGSGTNGKPAGHRYWGSGNYIWNNTGDTATLKNPTAKTVDTCTWRGTGAQTAC
jgi:lamin tail-like protein